MTTTAPSRTRSTHALPSLMLDVLFTLVIPLTLLRPAFPGSDIGFSTLVGPVGAYLTASLVPATYLLLSLLVARRVNVVTALAAASALLGAGLAFWPLSGTAFAIKDSSGSLFLLTVTTVSLALGRPLFRALLRVALMPDTTRREVQLGALLQTAEVHQATVLATRALQIKALTVVMINVTLKSAVVTAPFGSGEFNTQLATATAIMVPVAYLASALAYSAALWPVRRAFKRVLGYTVIPWGPRFWAAIEQAQAPR